MNGWFLEPMLSRDEEGGVQGYIDQQPHEKARVQGK